MKTKMFLFGVLATLILISGCEQTVNDPLLTKKGYGLLSLKITDAPFPTDLVEEANITIDWIKLKKADATEEETGDNSYFLVFENDATFDLLELNNGITAILAELEIPEGEYSEIRLHVVEASLKVKGVETEYSLKIPSGGSSGLKVKIDPAIVVPEGVESELLLDFDVSRSFKVIGNDKGEKGIKGFMFNPVVRAASSAKSGKLEGVVTDAASSQILNDAWITLLSGNDIIASSKSTSNGSYAIIGIPAGDYKVECAKEGYNPKTIENISIKVNTVLKQNFSLTRQ